MAKSTLFCHFGITLVQYRDTLEKPLFTLEKTNQINQNCRSHGNIYDLTASGATRTPANTPADEEFNFFGIGKADYSDEEDVGKSQYFDALETVEEVEEAIAGAAVVHAEDGLITHHPSVRPYCGLCILHTSIFDNCILCRSCSFWRRSDVDT